MFHFVLLRNKKPLISLYAILISMFSNNVLALNQIGLGNEILDPQDAFKMTITKIDDSLLLNWKIEKTYYLYQNSIKVTHKNKSVKFVLTGDPDPMPVIYRFFSLWGNAQLMFCLVCWVVIFRYKSLIPLMSLFWVLLKTILI